MGRWLAEVAAALGAALLVAGFAVVHAGRTPLNAWVAFPVTGTALLIAAGEGAALNRWLLSRRFLVAIGLISYPLYLWHWPLLNYSRLTLPAGHSMAVELGTVGLAFLLAWATHQLIERPIRQGRWRRRVVPAAVASVTLAGMAGWLAYRGDGYPERFPREIQELDQFAFTYRNDRAWRRGPHFLESSARPGDLPDVAGELRAGKPTLLLWGDSFAAQLYPGLLRHHADHFTIVQRTMIQTAPIIGLEFPGRPDARAVNDAILATARRIRPDCVILAGSWIHYDWRQIERTIRTLQDDGLKNIIVIGPLPEWEVSLPAQMLNHFRLHPGQSLPRRLKTGYLRAPLDVDAQMGPFCTALGVRYVSACSTLSDQNGFITLLGDSLDTLVAFDSSHLTLAGSDYFVGRLPPLLP